MTMRKDIPECQACGRCCLPPTPNPAFVSLFEEDMKRLPSRMVQTRDTPYHGSMLTKTVGGGKQCRCIALQGSVGKSVACSVYDNRPFLCRKFKRGGPGCLETLLDAGVITR